MIVPRRLAGDAPVFHGEFHDRAGVELAHRRAIELLPRRGVFGDRRRALFFAARDLFVADQRVAAARVEVDANDVAGAEPSEATAGGAFGGAVEDGGAVGGAGLATVAERGQALYAALEERIGRLHVDDFGGAGPADGA